MTSIKWLLTVEQCWPMLANILWLSSIIPRLVRKSGLGRCYVIAWWVVATAWIGTTCLARGSMGYHISCGCKLNQPGENKVSTKQISWRHIASTWFNWDSYTEANTKLESEIGKWGKKGRFKGPDKEQHKGLLVRWSSNNLKDERKFKVKTQ